MTLTTHLLTGAVIGSKLSNPILAFVAGVILHYFLDALPHYAYRVGDWDKAKESLLRKDFKNSGIKFYRIILDGFLAASLVFLFFVVKDYNVSLAAGALGGFLPDFFWGLYFLFPKIIPRKYYQFHEFFHWHPNKKIPAPGKILIEIITIIAALSFFIGNPEPILHFVQDGTKQVLEKFEIIGRHSPRTQIRQDLQYWGW